MSQSIDLSDAQLIEREVDAIYGLQVRPGKLPLLVEPDIRVVLAWTPHALLLAVSPEIDIDESLPELNEPYAPGAVPPVVSALARRLKPRGTEGADGPAPVAGGPTFVIPADVTAPAVNSPIIVSDDSGLGRTACLERPGNWEEDEWVDLTQGRIGEWAMALHGDEPVSICHSPASTKRAAEAGVWTREDFRGQGLAPATLVAWACQERKNKEVLFYSTWAANTESLAVARKLKLAALGWMWTIS